MSYIVVLGEFEAVMKIKDVLKTKLNFKFDWGNKVWYRECLEDKFQVWQKAVEEGNAGISACWVDSLSKVQGLKLAVYEMEQESKPAPEVKPHEHDGMVFEMSAWFAKRIKEEKGTAYAFRNFKVLKVVRETQKAFQIDGEFFSGIASTCGVCGRELTNDISRATGIGPVCAVKIGLSRPTMESAKQTVRDMEAMSKAQGVFQGIWVPKSQVKQIIDPKHVVLKNVAQEATFEIETDEDQDEIENQKESMDRKTGRI